MPETDTEIKLYVPVYRGTPEEAYAKGYDSPDAVAFRASLDEAVRCSRDIQSVSDRFGYELAIDPSPAYEVVEKHGPEMVAYCLASAVKTQSPSGFSDEMREWARGVKTSESLAICGVVAPLLPAGTADLFREAADEALSAAWTEDDKKIEEAYERAYEKYIEAWEKSMEERPASIPEDTADDAPNGGMSEENKERQDEFERHMREFMDNWEKSAAEEPASIPEDAADGTDKFAAEGPVDEELRDELEAEFPELSPYSHKRTWAGGDKSFTVTIPPAATVRKYSGGTLFAMPRGCIYEGYLFYAAEGDIKTLRGGNVSVTVRPTLGEETRLSYLGEDRYVTIKNLRSAFDGAEDGDFEPVTYEIKIPKDAVEKEMGDKMYVRFPDNSKYAGSETVISGEYKKVFPSEDGKMVFSVPSYVTFGVFNPDRHPRIPCEEFAGIMSDAEYKKRISFEFETLEISSAAVISEFERQTYLRMPKGGYEGYAYYIPNGMIEKKGDTMTVRLPKGRDIYIKSVHGGKECLNALQLKNLVSGKGEEDYRAKKAPAEKFIPGVTDGAAPEREEKFNGPVKD